MSAPFRVAVYAAPGCGPDPDPDGAALLDRAEAWLGRSVAHRPVAPAAPPGWSRRAVDDLTVAARRYGFHGTLKPPFRLADGRGVEELDAAVADLAARRAPVVVPGIALTRIEGFFALTPRAGADVTALGSLADDVVRELDVLRAPLSDAERDCRRPATLTERQRALLERWGYPYVLDEFRFHLTLTDRIAAGEQDGVARALRDWFAASIGGDLLLDALAVFVEPQPGAPFELHSRHALTGDRSPERHATLVGEDVR